MGNSVGVEVKPPSLLELLGETDEPEKSPSFLESVSTEPTYQSVLRGWKFSTSSNGLLGSTSPVCWLEFQEFSKDSCYLVVHAFVRDVERKKKKRDDEERDVIEPSGNEEKPRGSAGEIRSRRALSDHSRELREAASEKLAKLLESTELLTPRGQQTVFGGYHAPGHNRRKMTAVTYDIYVLRGQDANAISKSTATAKAVELERLLSDASAQKAVRQLCFTSDATVVAPFINFSNLYCLESMEMDLWSKSLARNHLFATIARYSNAKEQQAAPKKSNRSGSLPSTSQITTTSSLKRKSGAEPEPQDAGQEEVPSVIRRSPETRSRRKSRSRKRSREKEAKRKKEPTIRKSISGKTMLDHHFRSVSLPASEMKKLKSNAMGSRNVPAIKIPLGMNSLEQPVHDDEDDDEDDANKPMGGASMAKKFDHICSQITESLYLGSDTVARDSRELRRNKITHILNCAGGYCGNYFPQQFQYMTLHLLDGKSENIACLFYEVLEYVDGAISNGGRVFVHCQQGVSRSSAMLILYLMWKMNKPFNETHEYVKRLRQASSPNAGFISQLMEWWKRHTTPLTAPELYQVVPHCPVAPETIVFKKVLRASAELLDMRGCFVLRSTDAIFVWSGKNCPSPLKNWGVRYAKRLQKYENDASRIEVETAGEESEAFCSLLDGDVAQAQARPDYDASYQLLKLPSRSSLEKEELSDSRTKRKSQLASSSSSVGSSVKKKRKSKRKLSDRVASTSKIGRMKVSDS